MSTYGEADRDAVIVSPLLGQRRYFRLEGEAWTRVDEHVKTAHARAPEPFEQENFGKVDRLSWEHGGCEVKAYSVTFWGKRFAAWRSGDAIEIADATRPTRTRISSPLFGYASVLAHRERFYISTGRDVIIALLADVEALIDAPVGVITLEVHEIYPLRDPKARDTARVVRVADDGVHLQMGEREHAFRHLDELALKRGAKVTVHDLLEKDIYLELELADGSRKKLFSIPTESAHPMMVAHAGGVDPLGTTSAGDNVPRLEEVAHLLVEIADGPDDPATRSVLVDLLEDAGEPYAPAFAELLAGATDDETRRRALGALVPFVTEVTWDGGLPVSAHLVESPPLAEKIVEAVTRDPRLGMFRELRRANGPEDVYMRLVGSPRAVGLRRVDASSKHILGALLEANQHRVTHLYDMRFGTRTIVEMLADPTFSNVRFIECLAANGAIFDYIAKDELGVFARTKALAVINHRGDELQLLDAALKSWGRVPLETLDVAGIRFVREGMTTTCRHRPSARPEAIDRVRKAGFTVSEL